MWRLSSVLLLLVLFSLAAYAASPRRAYACSAGPDFDPIAASDVVVEGRFARFEVLPERPTYQDPKGGGELRSPFLAVRVEMIVERVYKGEITSATIYVVDSASLLAEHTDPQHAWAGSSGACGTFDSDPTGKYVILGLRKRDDGSYQAHRLRTFFVGVGPGAEDYEQAREWMASFPGAAVLPALGSGPMRLVEGPATATVIASSLAAASLVLLIASAAMRFRMRRRV